MTAINRHDAVAAAAFYAEDAKNHGRTVGRQGMQKVFDALFSTFPDFNYRIEEATAEGDRVVCKVMMTGTHLGKPTSFTNRASISCVISHRYRKSLHKAMC